MNTRHIIHITVILLLVLSAPASRAVEQPPANVPADVWGKVSRQIREERYAFRADESGVVRAENRKQGMGAGVQGSGFTVHGSDGREIVFSATGIGYGNELQALPAGEWEARGTRVECRRGNVTEWYVNEERGIEQGFTVHERIQHPTARHVCSSSNLLN